jgi:hypothetical protein
MILALVGFCRRRKTACHQRLSRKKIDLPRNLRFEDVKVPPRPQVTFAFCCLFPAAKCDHLISKARKVLFDEGALPVVLASAWTLWVQGSHAIGNVACHPKQHELLTQAELITARSEGSHYEVSLRWIRKMPPLAPSSDHLPPPLKGCQSAERFRATKG